MVRTQKRAPAWAGGARLEEGQTAKVKSEGRAGISLEEEGPRVPRQRYTSTHKPNTQFSGPASSLPQCAASKTEAPGTGVSLSQSPTLPPARAQPALETPPLAPSRRSLRSALGRGTQAYLVGMHRSPQVLHPLIPFGC